MNKQSLQIIQASLAVAVLGASASASNVYALDDGVPNSGLSYGIPTDYCWFQSFTTVGSTDAIMNVQLMLQPGGLVTGSPITVCVWEDPNDDGDPSDAILVAQQAGVVPNLTTYVFTTFALPNPGVVHNGFFIGAFITTDGNDGTISLLDYNTPLTGRAYFATDAPGFFDPAQLSSSFYNHIEILGAGIHGVFMLRAEGSGSAPVTYCQAKINSLGCQPVISYLGTPSASSPSGFFVQATSVLNRKSGFLLYTTAGRASTPFFGGTLCLASPLHRTPAQNSGGTQAGSDCTGVYSFDFNAWIAGGSDPSLVAGVTVDAQYYSRDPGFVTPDNVGLSNALEFTLQP